MSKELKLYYFEGQGQQYSMRPEKIVRMPRNTRATKNMDQSDLLRHCSDCKTIHGEGTCPVIKNKELATG